VHKHGVRRADSVVGGTQQGVCSHLQADVSIWATRGLGIEAVEPEQWGRRGLRNRGLPVLYSTTTALSSVRSHAVCRAARDGGATRATGLSWARRRTIQWAARPIVVCAAVVSKL
jgi:hypothetical protein